MAEPTLEEIADGFALWEEHRPQSGEDWVRVAERFIAARSTTENSSPLFAALVLAVQQRDQLLEAVKRHRDSLQMHSDDDVLYAAAESIEGEAQ